MKIQVPLVYGQLADKYGKYAAPSDIKSGQPIVSFPINISDAPAGTKSFALTLLDWDAVPVSGFAWIHWIAANIPAATVEIPADNSQKLTIPMVQGRNSTAGGMVGNKDPETAWHYNGPKPPDAVHNYRLSVFALDTTLDLAEGFWLNELQLKMNDHILTSAEFVIPSRN